MRKKDYLDTLYIDKEPLKKVKFNPYYKLIQSSLDRKILIDNKEVISLGSNNYLGIANNKEMKQKAKEALEKYGISMCGTPIVVGQTDINRALELKLAEFLKQEDVLLYPSCYQCNMGVFQVLSTGEDIIIVDRNIHSSLLNGCALSRAKFRLFPHNNTRRLEEILKRSQDYRMRFIVVEGLYSTEGDIPPLDKIVELAKRYNAFIIVDDAHGVGVLGKEGRGIMEVFNVFGDVDLVTGSLGKALATFGGFLAGKAKIIDFFRYKSTMLIYSTALPPSIAASAIASVDIVKNHPELREIIWRYRDRLYTSLKRMGYHLTKSAAPVFSVIFESTEKTIEITKALFERGVYVTPFVPPSVPKRSPRIRLIPTANLKEEDIEQVIRVFKEVKEKYL